MKSTTKTFHFNRKAFEPINFKEANELLNTVKRVGGKIFLCDFNKAIHEKIGFNAYIHDGMRFLKITAKFRGKIATYVFDKATGKKEEANRACNLGISSYMCMQRFLGKNNKYVPKLVNYDLLETNGKNIYPFATSPFLYCNPKFNGTEQKAYAYDMNSAYAYAMLGDFPDTSCLETCKIKMYNQGIVKENQIGFDRLGNLVEVGCFAAFRFNKIKSPFIDFANYYYKIKRDSKSKKERNRAKDILNTSVGFLQRVNPFIRATIVSRANNMIKSLMDENTLYCNTDSITSLVERPDLKIGKELGEFKLENSGTFRYKDMNYQWNDEPPAYRGIPKNWFKEGFNILKDELPICGNMFKLDAFEMKIVYEERNKQNGKVNE